MHTRSSIRSRVPLRIRRRPSPRRSQRISQRLLTVIRAALGFMFVAYGFHGVLGAFLKSMPHATSAIGTGDTLLVAGSMIPLLKGTEVLLETLLSRFGHAADRD